MLHVHQILAFIGRAQQQTFRLIHFSFWLFMMYTVDALAVDHVKVEFIGILFGRLPMQCLQRLLLDLIVIGTLSIVLLLFQLAKTTPMLRLSRNL
jgi:hypothetical protein